MIGETDREVADVLDRPNTPCDFAETIFRKLGIDTDLRRHKPEGTPVDFTEGGKAIAELC